MRLLQPNASSTLELLPTGHDDRLAEPWQRLLEGQAAGTWRAVDDEFPAEPELFQERHYREFVTFLPYVQRFLYREGATRGAARGKSPIRVLRQGDVKHARLTYPGDPEAVVLDVVHVDLYFSLISK